MFTTSCRKYSEFQLPQKILYQDFTVISNGDSIGMPPHLTLHEHTYDPLKINICSKHIDLIIVMHDWLRIYVLIYCTSTHRTYRFRKNASLQKDHEQRANSGKIRHSKHALRKVAKFHVRV